MAIFEYINGFYNPRHRHSAPSWKSPVAFERKVAKTSTRSGTKAGQVQPDLLQYASRKTVPDSQPTVSIEGTHSILALFRLPLLREAGSLSVQWQEL
jgi:hypothetical protein